MDIVSQGISFIKSGDFKNAFSVFEKGYFEQGNIECLCYLAQMFYDEKITKRTKESFSTASLFWKITAEKGVVSSKHKLGVSLFSTERPENRKDGLALISEADSLGYPLSPCVLGVIAFKTGKYREAVEYFKRYKDIEKDKDAYYCYINSLKNTQDVSSQEIAAAFEKYYEVSKDAEVLKDLVVIYEKMGNDSRWFELTKHLVDSGDLSRCEKFAQMIFKKRLYAEKTEEIALGYFGKLRAIKDVYSHYCLMEIYFALDNDKRTLEECEHVLFSDCSDELKRRTYYIKGFVLSSNNREEEGLNLVRKAYSLGYKSAATFLVNYYYSANDYLNAASYARCIIVDDILPDDKGMLGVVYLCCGIYFSGCFEDSGFDIDYRLSVEYFLKACELDNVEAMIHLALMYIDCDCVSTELAIHWLHVAENRGRVDAPYYEASVYAKLCRSDKVYECLVRSYKLGNARAAEKLSDLYSKGYFTSRPDKKKAREWQLRAEEMAD